MLWWRLRQIKSKNRETRYRAVEKLGNARKVKAVMTLVSLLQDSDYAIRNQAAEALGKIGDMRAVEPLIVALQDSDYSIREKSARALGKIGDARAIEPLVAALQDSNYYMREQAAEALEALSYQPTDETQQAILFVAKKRWWKAVELGPVAVEPLVVALKGSVTYVRQGSDKYVRREAAEALGKIGDARAVESLIAALERSDSEVQAKAAEALGKISDARAIEPLIVALQAHDYDVAREAETALRKFGEAAIEPLITALNDPSFDARRKAVCLLGQIGDARAVEPLIAELKKSGNYAVSDPAEALGKIGDARAVEPLIAALNRSNKYARRAVADALGNLGDVIAIEPLTRLLVQGDYQVGYDILPSLEKLRWTPVTDQERESVRQVEIYREQLRHRAARERDESRVEIHTKGGSSYWKCPKCGAILEKSMGAALRGAIADRIEGSSTCVPCGAVFAANDVYSGKYDVNL